MVVGTSNLGGINGNFMRKVNKYTKQRELSETYKVQLKDQIEAMMLQGVQVAVFCELNEFWFPWTERVIQQNPDFDGWQIYHDTLGVAILCGPKVEAAIDAEPIKVYDDEMLKEDPANKKRLDWRTIMCGSIKLKDSPQYPMIHLLAVHVYSGRDGLKRNSKVNDAQKRRIAEYSMLRGFWESPSIVAALPQGKCIQVCMGDWNLPEKEMREVCEKVLAWLRSKDPREQSKLSMELQCSAQKKQDFIVSFSAPPRARTAEAYEDGYENGRRPGQPVLHTTNASLGASGEPDATIMLRPPVAGRCQGCAEFTRVTRCPGFCRRDYCRVCFDTRCCFQ